MPTFPHTSVQTKTAFEPGDAGLNASAEPAQPLVYILTTAHVCLLDSALFGEANVFDLHCFSGFKVWLRCKSTVQGCLEWVSPVNILLPVEHRLRQGDIGRISFNDDTIKDQIGTPPGQTNFVAVMGITPVLNDNVSMLLENGYNLLACRNTFALQNSSFSLINNLRHTYASMLIEQGENIKYIQKQLGHSSPTVTLNVYAHLMKPVNQEAACRLENTIFEDTGHKTGAKS